MLAVIFDMDGVIVDNTGFHFRAWREVLKSYGVELSRQEYEQKLSGRTPEESGRVIFADRLSRPEILELNRRKESLYRSLYAGSVTAAPGLMPFLRDLEAEGVPVALATSAMPENIEFVLSATGIRRFFTTIVDATMVRRGKPDPEIFLTAAARLGAEPADCVVFEDSKFGMAAARAAGAKLVALATTLPPAEIHDADRVIRDFTEIGVRDLYSLGDRRRIPTSGGQGGCSPCGHIS
jgi:beta-phosphoglucomutase